MIVIAVFGLSLVAMPGALRRVSRAFDPSSWAKLIAVALASGMVLLEVSALVTAAPFALRAIGLSGLARICELMLGGFSRGGLALAIAAGSVALYMPIAALTGVRCVRRAGRRLRVEPGVGSQTNLPCGSLLVILPERRAVAVSVPGDPGQMVVSQGLIDSLDPAQFAMVCAHESAHLRLSHARYVALAVAARRALRPFPLAGRSVSSLRLALERWADEEAAGGTATQRKTLRDALLKVALNPEEDEDLAAFSGATTILERANALESPPATLATAWWPVLLVPFVTLGMVAAACFAAWGPMTLCAVGLTSRCM